MAMAHSIQSVNRTWTNLLSNRFRARLQLNKIDYIQADFMSGIKIVKETNRRLD